jgi:hypothetical protein
MNSRSLNEFMLFKSIWKKRKTNTQYWAAIGLRPLAQRACRLASHYSPWSGRWPSWPGNEVRAWCGDTARGSPTAMWPPASSRAMRRRLAIGSSTDVARGRHRACLSMAGITGLGWQRRDGGGASARWCSNDDGSLRWSSASQGRSYSTARMRRLKDA